MASALDVARYFLVLSAGHYDSDSSGISNLKLQKLLYYAQGYHLALFGKPLFDENLEAWMHGPVVASIYRQFKDCGSDFIPIDIAKGFKPQSVFTNEQTELIEEVHDVYGQFSAWKLRNMTHDETPWLEHESSNGVIPHSALMSYFSTRIK